MLSSVMTHLPGCGGARLANRRRSPGLLDPKCAPTGRRNCSLHALARVGWDEQVAAVALLAILRSRLIAHGRLRKLGSAHAGYARRQEHRASGKNHGPTAYFTGLVAVFHF